ncbi:hypothetical protein BaRGS_00015864 [Batillaria attramentaria]|uniref:Uncharacterized protein n=1 Tax=Batillaria attramentaria TaxID=370345 RepID=A0ABD0L0J1_9CAEN
MIPGHSFQGELRTGDFVSMYPHLSGKSQQTVTDAHVILQAYNFTQVDVKISRCRITRSQQSESESAVTIRTLTAGVSDRSLTACCTSSADL